MRHTQIRALVKAMRADGFTWNEASFQGLKSLLDSIPTIENFCFDLTVDAFAGYSAQELAALFGGRGADDFYNIAIELTSRCVNPCAFCSHGRHTGKMRQMPFIMFMKVMDHLYKELGGRVRVYPYSHSNPRDFRCYSTGATLSDVVVGLGKLGFDRYSSVSITTNDVDFSDSSLVEDTQEINSNVRLSVHAKHDYVLKRYAVPFFKKMIKPQEARERLAAIKKEYLRQYQQAIRKGIAGAGAHFRIMCHQGTPLSLVGDNFTPEIKRHYAAVWRKEKYVSIVPIFQAIDEMEDDITTQLKRDFFFAKDADKLVVPSRHFRDDDFISRRLKPGVSLEDFQQRINDIFRQYINHVAGKNGVIDLGRDEYAKAAATYLQEVLCPGISFTDFIKILQYSFSEKVFFEVVGERGHIFYEDEFIWLSKQVLSRVFVRSFNWSFSPSEYVQGRWADWLIDHFGVDPADVEELARISLINRRKEHIFNEDVENVVGADGVMALNGFESSRQRFRLTKEFFAENNGDFKEFVRFLKMILHSEAVGREGNNVFYYNAKAGETFAVSADYMGALDDGYFHGGKLNQILGDLDSEPDYPAAYEALKDVPIPMFWYEYPLGKKDKLSMQDFTRRVTFCDNVDTPAHKVNIRSAVKRFPLPVNAWVVGPEFVEEAQIPNAVAVEPANTPPGMPPQPTKGGVDWQNAGAQIKLEGKRAQFLTLPDSVTIDPKTFCGFNGKILAWETIDKED